MRPLLFGFLLTLSFVCHAQKRLVPFDFGKYGSTQAYTQIEVAGMILIVESIESKNDLLIFDVELINETGNVIDLIPGNFHIIASRVPIESREAGDPHNQSQLVYYALNNRAAHNYYEDKIKQGESKKTLFSVISAALIVYDAVKDGQDYYTETTQKDVNRSNARDVAVVSSLMAFDIVDQVISDTQIKADEDLYYLAEEILLDQLVVDGESVRGKVYFRRKPKARYYRLFLPLENRVFTFDFRKPSYEERGKIK